MNDCCASSASRDTPMPSASATLPTYAVRPGVTFPDWSIVTSPTVRDALKAMLGSGHVLNRWNGYDPATDRVRVALLQLCAQLARAPTAGALSECVGLSEESVRPLLEELRRRDLAVLDGDAIVGAYPFTDRHTGHRVTLNGRTVNALCAVDELGIALDADQLLAATGRSPNTEGLGLAEHGIALSPKGGIVVDDRMRTTRSSIYAAGDVTGRDQFVYMAAYGAKLAAKNALNGDSLRYDNDAMPAIVFTDPQAASVGLTEAAARAAGHEVRVSTIGLDQVPRAVAARDTRGLIKLVADADSGKLLGAHILAPEGADSIQTAALAITCGLIVQHIADTIFPYLTTVEGLKLAALAFGKDVAKLSCCAG